MVGGGSGLKEVQGWRGARFSLQVLYLFFNHFLDFYLLQYIESTVKRTFIVRS